MGSEKGAAADVVQELLADRPGNGQAVAGPRPPPHFVHDHEAPPGRRTKNIGGLVHFDEEGGLPPRQVVRGADAAEDPVDHADLRLVRGDEAPYLGHEDDEGGLAEVSRLARHVGTGEKNERHAFRVELGVVRDEFAPG